MSNYVEGTPKSTAYSYFDEFRGQQPNRFIDPEDGRGSVYVRRYLPGDGVNIQDE